MTATLSIISAYPSHPSRGATVGNARISKPYLLIESDRAPDSNQSDLVTLQNIVDWLQASADRDNSLLENVLARTYVLRTWILVTANVALDLRNTNLDIISQGSGSSSGAGIQLKAYGSNFADVLTGQNRARLLTGESYIIVENRDADRNAYGPCQRNASWINEGGNTTILVQAINRRYDWASNYFGNANTGTDNMVGGMLGLYDFQEPYTVAIVSMDDPGFAHTFIHADSDPFGYQIRPSELGGGLSTAGTPFYFEVNGGRFESPVLGNSILGVFDEKLAGISKRDRALTAFLMNGRYSARSLSIRSSNSFIDILNGIGSHTGSDLSNAANSIAGATMINENVSRQGQFRIAFAWQPTFNDSQGRGLNADGGRLDALLGTVSNSANSVYHQSGENMGVSLQANGTIEWTDPFVRSRYEPARTNHVRNHVRMPFRWTNERGTDSNYNTVFQCNTATWQLFKAGYLPPAAPTLLTYPFASQPHGQLTEAVVLPFDTAFGTTRDEVTAERVIVGQLYNLIAQAGRSFGSAETIYKCLAWLLETETASYATVADAWSAWNALNPVYADQDLRITGSLAFNQGLTKAVGIAGEILQATASAESGNTYRASVSINFNGRIPDCTVDSPVIAATVDGSQNAIQGLVLAQNATIDLNADTHGSVVINGVTGAVLTVTNSGSGNVSVHTDSPDNVAVSGSGVHFVYEVRFSEMALDGCIGLYRLQNGVPDIANGFEASNIANVLFSNLTEGANYRAVWNGPGFEVFSTDIINLRPGRTEVNVVMVPTANAEPASSLKAGSTIAASYTATGIQFAIGAVTADSDDLTSLQTNALFEQIKDTIEFTRYYALSRENNIIRHPSRDRTTVLTGRHRIAGADHGQCRHRVRGLLVHDANDDILTTESPVVLQESVTLDGTVQLLNQVILLDSDAAATYADVVSLIDGDDAAVTVEGFTDAAKEEITDAVIESGAV